MSSGDSVWRNKFEPNYYAIYLNVAIWVGVVALRYQHHTTECHNSHKHSQSPLTNLNAVYVLSLFFNRTT